MRRASHKRRNGGALLELALVLPFFLILILAIMELATLFFLRHAMLNAARDAARSYAIREFDEAGSIALATQRLPSIDVNFTVTATPDSDTGIDRWVQISGPINEITLGDPLRLFGGGDLAVRVTMRGED